MKKKIALFHPWLKSKGGAEKVVLELLKKSKHKIDVYTWVYDKENTFEEFEKYNVKVIAPKISQKLSRLYVLRGFLFPLGLLKKIPLKDYDKLLISTSGVAEFITFRNYKKGNTVAYVHTPLRVANKKIIKWNLENRYRSKLKKGVYILATRVYKMFEKRSWKKLDVVVFNSELSRARAHESRLLKSQDVKVIYPPISTAGRSKKGKDKKYFLYVSRINPPKRQDVLIEAWKKSGVSKKGFRLILVGNVDSKEYGKKIEALIDDRKDIEVLSNISNKDLENLYANCTAGLFVPYQEDFGIVPLEVLSYGKQLIGVDEGGFVDLARKSGRFHEVKEKHSRQEMINEISKELKKFLKKSKKKGKLLRMNNFVRDIDKILES
jgi:glycosyltransferase involved in cell wall biosynthesis